MRGPLSSGKRQGQERKDILQAVQEQATDAACAAIMPLVEAFLEADVSVTLGREKGERRRISGQPRLRDGECGHCGCQDADPWTRDGHDRRSLCTSGGQVSEWRVPMGAYQVCQRDVVSHVAMLEKDHRWWMDLDRPVLCGHGFAESVRQMHERWSASVEGCVGRLSDSRAHGLSH